MARGHALTILLHESHPIRLVSERLCPQQRAVLENHDGLRRAGGLGACGHVWAVHDLEGSGGQELGLF